MLTLAIFDDDVPVVGIQAVPEHRSGDAEPECESARESGIFITARPRLPNHQDVRNKISKFVRFSLVRLVVLACMLAVVEMSISAKKLGAAYGVLALVLGGLATAAHADAAWIKYHCKDQDPRPEIKGALRWATKSAAKLLWDLLKRLGGRAADLPLREREAGAAALALFATMCGVVAFAVSVYHSQR